MRTAILAVAGGVVLWGAGEASLRLRDVDGNLRSPLAVMGQAAVLFFIATDCPISNFYAPEVQGICKDYGTKGVTCSLVYEDVQTDASAVRKHMTDFQYRGFTGFMDLDRKVSAKVNATVTPEAVVLDRAGKVRYRGRIDNFYADLGKPRRQATVHDLRDALDAVLAGRTVAVPETHAVGCYIVSPDVLKK
ncbi:MAG TPA: redoxin domain-containing protein [Bryobacteraceae bacterium]|nr:redoxin domain-containing protein [Bryobacteraceae bacterium]